MSAWPLAGNDVAMGEIIDAEFEVVKGPDPPSPEPPKPPNLWPAYFLRMAIVVAAVVAVAASADALRAWGVL